MSSPPSTPSHSHSTSGREQGSWTWILLVSAAATAFLFWILYFKGTPASGPQWVTGLPALNALLNALCASCLIAGVWNIRRGRRRVHRRFMLSGLVFSVLFLLSYVTYHNYHGDTPFPGQGWIRPVYFVILVSHILLSIVVLPLILATVTYAMRERFPRHRKIARFTFPIWLYVSVTGVLVFLLLRWYS